MIVPRVRDDIASTATRIAFIPQPSLPSPSRHKYSLAACCGCEHASIRLEDPMSTNATAGNTVQSLQAWKKCPPVGRHFSIGATASVNADRHRIYQALTVPEYIEAWFSAPGAIAGHTAVSTGENSFSIHWSTPEDRFRIFCSYQVRRRSKLIFTWQPFTLHETTSSMVRIRLLGDFGRTTVQVTHIGLTPSDEQWYKDLWALSLTQLSRLF